MKIQNNKNRGFTLLEILVVMIIIGILAVIGLRSFTQSQTKSRDAKRKNDLEQMERALEMFRSDKGYYPVNNTNGVMELADGTEFEWGTSFYDPDNHTTLYMPDLPEDPSGMRYYYQAYQRDSSATNGYRPHDSTDAAAGDHEAEAYKIFARLENPMDQQIENLDPATTPDCSASGTGSMPCNYFVYSLNIQPDW